HPQRGRRHRGDPGGRRADAVGRGDRPQPVDLPGGPLPAGHRRGARLPPGVPHHRHLRADAPGAPLARPRRHRRGRRPAPPRGALVNQRARQLLRRFAATPPGRAARRVARDARAAVVRASQRVAPPDTGTLDPVLGDLARAALAGAGPATLTAIGLRLRSPDVAAVLDEVGKTRGRPRWRAGAAMVTAGLGGPEDRARALALLRDLCDTHGPEVLDDRQQLVLAQLLFLARADRELTEVLPRLSRIDPADAALLRTDLLNPARAGDLADPDAWAERFADPWEGSGLLRPRVQPAADGHLFDTLHVAHAGAGADVVADGPLVTVVVPAFRPDAGLLTAVRSLCAQTWSRLEILLVDDASGPDHAPLLHEAAALDPRVRLLRRETNGGSYLCR